MSESSSILVTYDNSKNDISTIICGRYRHDGEAKICAGYTGESADELYKMVSEPGYLYEHDEKVRNSTIKDVLRTIRNGMSELLESPWANESYMSSHDFVVRETMSIIDDLILKKDIEQCEQEKKHDNT